MITKPKKPASWFFRFVVRLRGKLHRSEWPLPESEYWVSLYAACVKERLTEADLDIAADRLQATPPKYFDDIVPELLEHANRAKLDRELPREAAMSREDAIAASRHCDDCLGTGFATRWRHKSAGKLDAKGRPLPPSFELYCRCPLGRVTKADHVRGHVPLLADLEEHHFLWGHEYRRPPGIAPADTELAAAGGPRRWFSDA